MQFQSPARPKNGFWQHYFNDRPEFDRWLKANAVLGSLLAIGTLVMALAGLYAAPELVEVATEFSSVSQPIALTGPLVSPQGMLSSPPQAEADAAEDRRHEQDINSGITYPDDRQVVQPVISIKAR